MPFAAGSRHEVSYVAETIFGTTPATPTMKRFRATPGVTLGLRKDTLNSEELRADAEITDQRHGNRRVDGDLTFQLSYGAFDDWLEALLGGTWTTNVLKTGTTVRSFTVERRFTDIARYRSFTGVVPTRGAFVFAPGRMVQGTIGCLGRDMVASGTTLGVPTDVNTSVPYDNWSGTISEGGSTIAIVTGLTINIDKGYEPNYVLFSSLNQQAVPDRNNVSGRLSAFFVDEALAAKFHGEVESSISLTLDGPAGDLTFLLPRVKYNGDDIRMNGGRAMMLDLPFQALRHPTDATALQVTRAP